jgi:shikimate kinase
MNVLLMGYRGSGKTTIGRMLADRLWLPFVDLDETIVRSAGMSIAEIFSNFGEPHFRDVETQCLREALVKDAQVIALGGGTVVREENRSAIKSAGCKPIYLRCEPRVLAARIAADDTTAGMRPNLTPLGGGIDEVRLKLTEREPIYREVMDCEIDVTNLSPAEVVVHLARML